MPRILPQGTNLDTTIQAHVASGNPTDLVKVVLASATTYNGTPVLASVAADLGSLHVFDEVTGKEIDRIHSWTARDGVTLTNCKRDIGIELRVGMPVYGFFGVAELEAIEAALQVTTSAVGLNTTHRTGNGSDHADVGLNTAHRSGDGSDHADVGLNTAHRSGDGSDHADVGLNTAHRSGDGSDHADVASNTLALAAKSNIIQTTKRLVFADSPYTVLVTDEVIFADTDGGAIVVNYPVGIDGTALKVANCGSSGNDVALTPNGAETMLGVAAAYALIDGNVLESTFETTEGWW